MQTLALVTRLLYSRAMELLSFLCWPEHAGGGNLSRDAILLNVVWLVLIAHRQPCAIYNLANNYISNTQAT